MPSSVADIECVTGQGQRRHSPRGVASQCSLQLRQLDVKLANFRRGFKTTNA